jgi:hypothetical protein
MAGLAWIGRAPCIVRRLAPQEDRLDLAHASPTDLEHVVRHLGMLVGSAHRHGGVGAAPRSAWSSDRRRAILHAAADMAEIHLGVFEAFCKLVK